MEETSFLRCVERKDKSGRFGESPKPSLSHLVSKGLQDAAKVMNCLFSIFCEQMEKDKEGMNGPDHTGPSRSAIT